MDLSSSSSTQQQYNQDQHNHHRLEIQERDWLSCSTSTRTTTTAAAATTTTTQDIDVDIEDDNNNNKVVVVEREHMFDKVVTPSDVGKLNRLVIPKQHAEKYFPLDTTNNSNNNNASSSSCGNNISSGENNKAGLLLNFEDRTGKSWRFRYSYWNSSQSYVMTKGWSRFVKEKQLSAGDIVSFQRAVGDDIHSKNTFFIDWRRRPPPDHHHLHHHHHHLGTAFSVHHSIPTWRGGGGGSGSGTTPSFFLRSHPHEPHPHPHHHNALWDHSNIININNSNSSNSNNINSHLSPINGNIMSMVPCTHGGPMSGSGSGSESGSRSSLILLRSPIPNSGLLNHHPYLMPNNNPHHFSNTPWTSNCSDPFHGSVVRRDEPPKVYDSVPVVHGIATSPPMGGGGGGGSGGVGNKRSLRLFGVNMEYDQMNSGSNSMGISTTLSMLSNASTTNLDDPQNSSPSNHSFGHG